MESNSVLSRSLVESNGVILPLSYLPSIDQYCYMVQKESVLFELQETYPKQTCRNRTFIYTANGILRLSIPVIKTEGNSTRTFEVMLDNKTPWNLIHWKAISSAYNNSPYFLYYKDDFWKLFQHPEGLLIDFNLRLINLIHKLLKINPFFEFTTNYEKEYTDITDKRICSKDINLYDHRLNAYTQVFSDRFPFIPNLSILDLLFSEGPYALNYLKEAELK